MNQNFLPGTQIEIVNEIPRGQFKHVLFDFDGTISLLREGWQGIMVPVCIEMICGDSEPTDAIREAVAQMIDETTGIQTIFQMERLVEMIREYALVPEAQMLDAAGYKAVYNERLLVPVRERLARLESGALSIEDATVPGALRFLKLLHGHGAAMYVFSGTDRDDVRHECAQVKANHFFQEIWGAIPSVEEYSKEKVIREIIAQHGLHGSEVLAVGDGPVELRNVKEHGGVALGIASDETNGGWDMHKRARLLKAGADILVPDFSEAEALYRYLMAVE
jgi:phosphoglycolate phosphatase-like HAD superfamily hydrolase